MTQSKNIIYTDNVSYTLREPEPIQPKSGWRKFARFVIAGVFMVAMLYLGGVYQFFQFQTTPESAQSQQYESLINEDIRQVPVSIFVLGDSNTSAEQIEQLIENTNGILSQASVQIVIESIENEPLEETNFSGAELVANPRNLADFIPGLANNRLTIAITETLGGLNGVAFSGQQAVAVAEYTTSFDFRVLAHEVGHALSLEHVGDRGNLMNSGGRGDVLTQSQAQKAYDAALQFDS